MVQDVSDGAWSSAVDQLVIISQVSGHFGSQMINCDGFVAVLNHHYHYQAVLIITALNPHCGTEIEAGKEQQIGRRIQSGL